MSITRVVATYRLTTPMFCSGADQECAELRPASFKGALRFWYRALALAECGNVNDVQKAEAELFGSTDKGQAKVRLSMREIGSSKTSPKGEVVATGFGYLAGQGLAEYKKETKKVETSRSAILPGARFDVTLLFRNPTPQEITDARRALIALGLLGGLGARTRRGLGSITLEKLVTKEDENIRDPWAAPSTMAGLEVELKKFLDLGKRVPNDPEYSAFSAGSRILLLDAKPNEDAKGLLERVGKAFLHYRSYGNNGRVAGTDALYWFKNDHDEMLAAANGDTNIHAPDRAVFGLPHNYFFSSLGRPNGIVEVNAADAERRASPLFLHIHEPDGARPIGVVTFLPALFLPNMQLTITPKRTKQSVTTKVPSPPDLWLAVHKFLNELVEGRHSELIEKFPAATEVKS
jgi:CRISPR-associated protein Cmr1